MIQARPSVFTKQGANSFARCRARVDRDVSARRTRVPAGRGFPLSPE